MSDEQFRHYIKAIQRQIAGLKGEQAAEVGEESAAALEGLQLIYEEMQTSLEAAEVVEENLFQQNQRVSAGYHHYYDLFYSSPIAYLVTDASGVILEANQAIAQLLNVPQRYLAGKPLTVFVAPSERLIFHTKLNQLYQTSEVQHWQMSLCPREREPFVAQLNVAIVCNSGLIESLRIGVYDISQSQQRIAQLTQQQNREEIRAEGTVLPLPQALDGLQVLIVDDEADAREFIAAVLESHGVRVTAVASAAAALETLEQFHPDVLMSDIRMPQEDGYSLIRKVRELEAKQGWHIPAAALTAYLDESLFSALSAGFEAHLHKLAQPSELIKLVAQLAGCTSTLPSTDGFSE